MQTTIAFPSRYPGLRIPDLVVIPCAATKATQPGLMPARDRYRSGTFTMHKAAAGRLAARHQVRILSARYGLVMLDQEIPDYDVTWGDRDAISVGELAAQLELIADATLVDRLAVHDYAPSRAERALRIDMLLPSAYRDQFTDACTRLRYGVDLADHYHGTRGLLDQRKRLGEIARGER